MITIPYQLLRRKAKAQRKDHNNSLSNKATIELSRKMHIRDGSVESFKNFSSESLKKLSDLFDVEINERALLVLPNSPTSRKRSRLTTIICLSGAVVLVIPSILYIFFKTQVKTRYSMGIVDKYPKIPERLIFEEDFDYFDKNVWNIEKNIAGGGNNEFQYYTDDRRNIWTDEGVLNIQPALFTQLPLVETISGSYYTPEEVMTGTCEPYPECATFTVSDCNDPRFNGCEKTGNDPTGWIINPVTSGRINTKGKFSFKYGRLEIRARLPQGDWLWPAIWMLSEEGKYGKWPNSGEIDIMESRGNDRSYYIGGVPCGRNTMGSTLHFGNVNSRWNNSGDILNFQVDGWPHAHNSTKSKDKDPDFSETFYTYGLYWDKDAMYTYIVNPDGDEEVVLDLREGYQNGFWKEPLGYQPWPGWGEENNIYAGKDLNAPFNEEFYLILNVAVGGNLGQGGYFQNDPWGDCEDGSCSTAKLFWEKKDEWYPSWVKAGKKNAMQVDWIKVWQ